MNTLASDYPGTRSDGIGETEEAGTKLIQLRSVSKIFGGVHALQDVSFDIEPGEVLCLAGENGCGKSTLIKVINGVYKPEPGAEFWFQGRRVQSLSPAMARKMGIQVIWQDLAIFPELSVAENIAFEYNLGNIPGWVSYRRFRKKAADILSRLGVSLDPDIPVKHLSIAQRQIVAIARALITEARLVFMDEPTASLSQKETEALLVIVRRLSAQGIAVVFVSHRLAEVLDVCSRVTVLRDGRWVGTYPTEGMTQNRLTELMTGNQFNYETLPPVSESAEDVLRVEKLSRAGEFKDLSFSVRAGEVVGFTGLMGSGRTELALSLFGVTRPDSGKMLLSGKECRFRRNSDAIHAGVAYVSEDRLQLGLIQEQSIADNTVSAVLDQVMTPIGLMSFKARDELVNSWISELSVKTGSPSDPVSTLSGGNQQRIVLAKWMATHPKLLILDSPTVGVDVGARAGIFRIVRQLADQGMAIILISDEIPEVYFNSNRIFHLRNGQIADEFYPAEISAEEIEGVVHG